MSNLIDEATNIISNMTDAPTLFIKAGIFTLLSTCLGWTITEILNSPPGRESKRPNTWFLISGPPATGKSTVANIVKEGIKVVFTNYWRHVLPHAKPEEIRELVRPIIFEGGSPEGIIDHIETYHGNVPAFAIINPEFGLVLNQIRKKDYMADFDRVMSMLYSGEGGHFYFSRRGRKEKYVRILPEGVYITFFGATQEPWLFFSKVHIDQGLLRRMILVYVKDSTRYLPLIYPKREVFKIKLENIIKQISERVIELAENRPLTMTLTSEASSIINKIDKRYRCQKDSYWKRYTSTFSIHILKLAAVIALTYQDIKKLSTVNINTVTIDSSDIISAFRFIREIEKETKEAINYIASQPQPQPVVTIENILTLIENKIKDAGEVGISKTQLLREVKIPMSRLREYLLQLIEEEKIIAVKKRSKTRRGRKPIVFYHKDYEKFAITAGEVLSIEQARILI